MAEVDKEIVRLKSQLDQLATAPKLSKDEIDIFEKLADHSTKSAETAEKAVEGAHGLVYWLYGALGVFMTASVFQYVRQSREDRKKLLDEFEVESKSQLAKMTDSLKSDVTALKATMAEAQVQLLKQGKLAEQLESLPTRINADRKILMRGLAEIYQEIAAQAFKERHFAQAAIYSLYAADFAHQAGNQDVANTCMLALRPAYADDKLLAVIRSSQSLEVWDEEELALCGRLQAWLEDKSDLYFVATLAAWLPTVIDEPVAKGSLDPEWTLDPSQFGVQ